jgi:hypothetical protein
LNRLNWLVSESKESLNSSNSRLLRAISKGNPDESNLTVDSTARLYAGREDFTNKSPDDILRTHLAGLWNQLVKPVFGALNLFLISVKQRNPNIPPAYGGAQLECSPFSPFMRPGLTM